MDSEKVRKVFYANSSPFYSALFSKKILPTSGHLFNPNQRGYGLLTDSRSGKTVVPIVDETAAANMINRRRNSDHSPSPPTKKRKINDIFEDHTTTTTSPKKVTVGSTKKKKKGEATALDKLKIHLFKD